MDRYIKAIGENWVRPADWLDIDSLVDASDEMFVGLFAVYPDKSNIASVYVGQAFTVDWGDGTITNYGLGYADYSYTFGSIPASTETTEGFRQVVIKIYAQANPWTAFFNPVITRVGVPPTQSRTNFIDIRASLPNVSSVARTLYFNDLKKFNLLGTHQSWALTNMFIGAPLREFYSDFSNFSSMSGAFNSSNGECVIGDITSSATSCASMFVISSVKEIGDITIDSATNISNMFNSSDIITVGDFSASSATSTTSIFTTCSMMREIGGVNIPSATNLSNLFPSCVNLESVGTLTVTSATNLTSAFYQCFKLKTINITSSASLLNITSLVDRCVQLESLSISSCSGVTTTTNALTSCHSLNSLTLTGLTRGITIPPCQMDDTAFANFFTGLGIAFGVQNIIITGNITLSAPTLAIATGKGFTIIP